MLTVLNADLAVFGNKFELALAPGRTIEGVVSDHESRLPLVGWRVIGPTVTRLEYPGFDRFFATTDKTGHYRIDGFPIMRGARFKVEAARRTQGGRVTKYSIRRAGLFRPNDDHQRQSRQWPATGRCAAVQGNLDHWKGCR